jgi:mannose-1-phosphate guanylyltransferase/mannose-6-phosphate isomerase
VVAKDSNNSLIYSEKPLVTALGIQEHIIVATSDAVLVADKRYAQQVKDMVAEIKNSHSPLLNDHARILCPWGYFEILAEGEAFKVKRLMVKPGAKLSLQLHQHRTEHWVVVQGCAEVINGDAHLYLQVNQSTYIEKNTKHRLGNPTSDPLFVIEVQSGNYLGEDDIQRFDDLYPREILQYE